jgi:hypothetical protein
MMDAPIDRPRRIAARTAGFLYIFTNFTAMLGYAVRGPLFIRDNAFQTAKNILASERMFRISVASDLFTVACVIVLVMALHTVLEPVNRGLARLATAWRLAENFVLGLVPLIGLVIVALLHNGTAANESAPLVTALYRAWGSGFNIGFFFLGLGSTVFSYLWLQSGYIPRVIAAWGIFASIVLAIVSLAILIFPKLSVLGLTYMMPMGLYELGLGLWLLIKGIRAPVTAESRPG